MNIYIVSTTIYQRALNNYHTSTHVILSETSAEAEIGAMKRLREEYPYDNITSQSKQIVPFEMIREVYKSRKKDRVR
jgi:hypothetical protein